MKSHHLFCVVILLMSYIQYGAGQCLSDKTCNGHGTCSTSCGVCTCTDDYTGQFCQIPPDCTVGGGQCGDNGACDATTLRCDCRNKWAGRYCHIPPVCTAGGGECGQYGECDTCTSNAINICRCNSGYGGDRCEIAPACTDGGRECQNGGVCDFTKSPFVCTCLPDFKGTTCGAGSHVPAFTTLMILAQIAAYMLNQ